MEWLGQQNGALPQAQTPGQPQGLTALLEQLESLIGIPGATILSGSVASAVASGSPDAIRLVAHSAEAAGAADLAAYLRAREERQPCLF